MLLNVLSISCFLFLDDESDLVNEKPEKDVGKADEEDDDYCNCNKAQYACNIIVQSVLIDSLFWQW